MATAKITPAPLTRNLSAIALDIRADYRSKGRPVYFAAAPYVDALLSVHSASLAGQYGDDDLTDAVTRLLGNLSTWRGPVATRVRAELRSALAHHQSEQVRQQIVSLMSRPDGGGFYPASRRPRRR